METTNDGGALEANLVCHNPIIPTHYTQSDIWSDILAFAWAMARRRPIRRIWAWRAWRLTGRWSDGGRRSTVPGWTRRRAAPAYARIPDLIYHRPENLRIHTPDSMDISGTYRPETR